MGSLKKEDRIILDEDREEWSGPNIILMAELTEWKNTKIMDEKILRTQDWFHTPTDGEISAFMTTKKPKYLLYSPRGEFPDEFRSIETGDILIWKGHSFKRIPYNGEHYRIFEINSYK